MTSANPSRYAPSALYPGPAFDGAAMLVRIGSDLRDLYGDLAEAALPGDLLRLAGLIDGKRETGGEDESAL